MLKSLQGNMDRSAIQLLKRNREDALIEPLAGALIENRLEA
ncbi:MAG: hypothetical protein ACI8P0_003269 [Planctomycetaceae bacterium]|jgi:hypothetical protein